VLLGPGLRHQHEAGDQRGGDHGDVDEEVEQLPQLGIDPVWVPTGDVTGSEVLVGFPGVLVVPGAPYQDQAGVHRAIRFAHESHTCSPMCWPSAPARSCRFPSC
jgi:hypothetical protein